MLKDKKKQVSVKSFFNPNLNLPEKNESIFSIEDNGNAIFNYLVSIAYQYKIDAISISSFRISKKDLSFLEELISLNKLPVPRMLLSDSIPSMVVGTYNYLNGNKNFITTYVNTHAKYCIIKTECNKHFCIFSSGNFNPDGKLEQLTILDNQDVFLNFNKFVKQCQAEKEI